MFRKRRREENPLNSQEELVDTALRLGKQIREADTESFADVWNAVEVFLDTDADAGTKMGVLEFVIERMSAPEAINNRARLLYGELGTQRSVERGIADAETFLHEQEREKNE